MSYYYTVPYGVPAGYVYAGGRGPAQPSQLVVPVLVHDGSRGTSPTSPTTPHGHVHPAMYYRVSPATQPAGRTQPVVPPTPYIPPVPLPSTPALQQRALQSEGDISSRRPSSLSSPRPAPSPSAMPGLSAFAHGRYVWNVRARRFPDGLPTHYLDASAFPSEVKSCRLYFPAGRDAGWSIAVGPFVDTRPVTVKDVLAAIGQTLYERVESTALHRGMARYADAVRERPGRERGREDAERNMFRNVDLIPEGLSYFRGLVKRLGGDDGDARGAHYEVVFGRRSSRSRQ
ncbi:hypothetical protein C8Q80DRAFT_343072 [Daedaleopsis nitida]|nr:hypothetical protein C8Q80DRAFT_343072 [Daedaleopsis nitida]